MLQISPAFPLAFAALLCAAGFLYMLGTGHQDPLRLAVAGLGGAAVGLAVAPVLERAAKGRA